MIIDHFGPGDSLVETLTGLMTESPYAAQGFITKTGKKILLVNKRNRPLQIKVPSDFNGAELNIVSISSGESKPIKKDLKSLVLEMEPYSVIVAKLTK